jgi:hypothetical protein
MILMGALVAFAGAVVFAALLGSGASSAGADEACPNEAIRLAQHATQLPDCRAWERVSPADKGDGDLVAEKQSTIASGDGGAVAFDSKYAFGDAIGTGSYGFSTYLARRGAAGWATHSLMPLADPEASQVLAGGNQVLAFADHLGTALLFAYDLPAVSGDTPARENIYSEDTATGALRPISVSQQQEPSLFDFTNGRIDGYSADGQHVAFITSTQMLPQAAEDGSPNLYKWDDGVLSLAGVLPDGSLPPGGATAAVDGIIKNFKYSMSPDGSRLAFSASPTEGAPPQLYLHVDGKPSVWVSEPEMSDENDKTPRNGIVFEGMTPDGKNVFFSSEQPLVEADNAPGPDVYRFTYSADPAHDGGNLTLITNNGQAVYDGASGGGTLVGMSEDAKRVYLTESGDGLKLWQEGVPGLVSVDPSASRPLAQVDWLTLLGSGPGNGRVSPDGNWLAYVKVEQMYLYDRAAESLTCVSCPAEASLVPTITHTGGRFYPAARPRFLADDGRVFFTSTDALVPEDTNGVADTYEYDGQTGVLSLISSGKGSEPAEFADAGASGDDVFIFTRQQLVPSDTDEYADLYDVRVGGGFDEPQPPPTAPCKGEACQAASGATPASPAIASATATRGNLHPRCAKNQHKVRHNGKVRCAKKRHAKHNRRASR